MNLYSVGAKGGLRKVSKADFIQKNSYIVDDIKNIYVWFGMSVSANQKDLAIKKAKSINKERNEKANIQIMNQDEEYGGFLAIMDILRVGFQKEGAEARRVELEIEYDDTLELLDVGLDPDFEAEITIAAQEISDQKNSYEELCKILAQEQLELIKSKPTKKEIDLKAVEILRSSATYEELCWLIAELSELKNKQLDQQ